jgi:hypothetical protein
MTVNDLQMVTESSFYPICKDSVYITAIEPIFSKKGPPYQITRYLQTCLKGICPDLKSASQFKAIGAPIPEDWIMGWNLVLFPRKTTQKIDTFRFPFPLSKEKIQKLCQ